MLGTIMSFFGGWKVKLAISLIIISGAYFWHLSEVKIAVNNAEIKLIQKYNQELNELKEKAKHSTSVLIAAIESNNKERKIELKKSNRKYTDLQQWVRHLPTLPSKTSSTDLSRDSNYPEDSSREVIGELSRKNADDLIEYSHDTEELKIHLVQCYKDYEAVKESIDTFGRE